MPDWKEAVVRVTNNLPSDDDFGSGFAFHRDASGRSFVMTCKHVVDSLLPASVADGDAPPALLVSGLPADVTVSGDQVLDLAVLEVDGLDCAPLTLADAPADGATAFCGAGYSWMEADHDSLVPREVTGTMRDRNPVTGRLWARRKPVPYWDLSIDDDQFRKLKPGYSGGPLLHAETGLVVGVFNLKLGTLSAHALCIEAHRLLEPALTSRVPGFSAGARAKSAAGLRAAERKPARPPGETAATEGRLDWLAGTIDHVDPIRQVEEGIGTEINSPGGPRIWFCAVDGRRDDFPRALAIHLAAQFGGAARGLVGERQLVTRLGPGHYGAQSTWQQLLATQTLEGEAIVTAADEEERILRWINSESPGASGLRVIYTELDIAHRRHIPGMIRGAIERFTKLGGIDPRLRLLFLYGLARERDGWVYLLGRRLGRRLAHGRSGMAGCDHLGGLHPITRMDLEDWLDRLEEVGTVRVDVDTLKRLRAELLRMFMDRGGDQAQGSERPRSDSESLLPQPARTVRYRALYERALPILRTARPVNGPGQG